MTSLIHGHEGAEGAMVVGCGDAASHINHLGGGTPTFRPRAVESDTPSSAPFPKEGGDADSPGSVLDTDMYHSAPRPHLDPQGDPVTPDRIITLDAEKEGWRYSTSTGERNALLTFDALLDPDGEHWREWAGGRLIAEDAHLRPAHDGSKAQVYSPADLDRLASIVARHGITVRLASALHTAVRRRARDAGTLLKDGEVDKARDSEALLAAVQSDARVARKEWRPNVEPAHSGALAEIRADMTRRQNRMRSYRVGLEQGRADKARMIQTWDAIRDGALFDADLADAIEWASRGDQPKKSGERKTREPRPVVEAIWTACTTEGGRLRTTPAGEFIGVRFVTERVLQLHDFGRGLGRSQFVYHTLRVEERAAFGRYDPTQADPHRDARRALRGDAQRHLRRLVSAFRNQLQVMDSDRVDSAPDADKVRSVPA
jgi:hypothetical protein